MEQNQNTIAPTNHQHAIRVKFHDHFLTSSSVGEKKWPLLRGYFGSSGHALVTVAVVERFK